MNQSVSFFQRLKDARLNLGLNQTDFAQIGGVTKKTQMLYESGERAPDSTYLSAIAEAGVDVLYILTGIHAATHGALGQVRTATALANKLHGSVTEKAALAEAAFQQLSQPLPADEQMWLDCYRDWSPALKKQELARALRVSDDTNAVTRSPENDIDVRSVRDQRMPAPKGTIHIGKLHGQNIEGNQTNHGPMTFGASPPPDPGKKPRKS